MVVHVVVDVGSLAKFAYSLKIGSLQLRLFRSTSLRNDTPDVLWVANGTSAPSKCSTSIS